MKINWNVVAEEFVTLIHKLDNDEYIDLRGNTHHDYGTAIFCNRNIIADINDEEMFESKLKRTEEGFVSVNNGQEFTDATDAMIYLMKEYLANKEED